MEFVGITGKWDKVCCTYWSFSQKEKSLKQQYTVTQKKIYKPKTQKKKRRGKK